MKNISLVAAALLLANGAAHAQTATLDKIAETGKITLAYRESSVPFSYLEGTGKPIGFSVEIALAVADAVRKKTGKPVSVEWSPVTSANRISLVSNGTIDLECGSTTNNATRAKDVDFAINHFYTGTRLLVKKSSKIKGYADLAEKPVVITTGTTNVQVMRKYNVDQNMKMNMSFGKDHADSFLLVESDRATAFAMDDILLFGLIASAKNPADFEVVGEALQVEPYACMMRKNDPQFKTLVDGVITDLMKSGQFDKMYTKWFMSPIPPRNTALGLPMNQQLRDNIKNPNNTSAM